MGSGLYSRPDPRCAPGALNRRVTEATIKQTICRRGWTSTVRPPESVTEQEKAASMADYGDHRPLRYYEYDHFVPLELGGATNDRRNLWPEPGASPNPKDAVERTLNRQVCEGNITLARAERLIVSNWVALAAHKSTPPPVSSPAHRSRGELHSQRAVLKPLQRLRRLRALKPARSDGHGHTARRHVEDMAHRQLRVRRRLLLRRTFPGGIGSDGAARRGHVPRHTLN
jgi:hypothetical protein